MKFTVAARQCSFPFGPQNGPRAVPPRLIFDTCGRAGPAHGARQIEGLAGDWRWLDQRIEELSNEIEKLVLAAIRRAFG